MVKNFALLGVSGYIAPKHLDAIKDVGGNLLAVTDPHDSAGKFGAKGFMETKYYQESEQFWNELIRLRKYEGKKTDLISICTPNYLHRAQSGAGMEFVEADIICEKPLIVNPKHLDQLELSEEKTRKKVYGIMQLRLLPSLKQLKENISKDQTKKRYKIDLEYITPRNIHWYVNSWKGDDKKSGGLASNIGIHLFDMLQWIYGDVGITRVYQSEPTKMRGSLELKTADVDWFLSIDPKDLPEHIKEKIPKGKNIPLPSYRLINVDGEGLEFSDGFENLHTKSYKEILAGRGFRIKDLRPSLELVYRIRNTKTTRR